jgi:8-oxo-dGTP pyrophosphatase MutT (NUDIX family)
MRFEDVERRLGRLPTPLPLGRAELTPIVLVAGKPAQAAGAPGMGGSAGTGRLVVSTPTRDAAALVLLYPDARGEAHLVLTLRPPGEHAHAGQVALPGGKREPGEDFPVGTALREASEEVGLDASSAGVCVLGRLDTVDVRVTGFRMVPVLAVAERSPRLVPHPREVAAILRVPVRRFLPRAPVEMVEEERGGWRVRYGAYPIGPHRVWGATGQVLAQLGAVVAASR